ncbi:MAG: hypothetical protein LBJ08_00125 [Bifidobacteriaceae bacterium]|nr:hypothetical protein [Bifidobacteriaceae bacterium]
MKAKVLRAEGVLRSSPSTYAMATEMLQFFRQAKRAGWLWVLAGVGIMAAVSVLVFLWTMRDRLDLIGEVAAFAVVGGLLAAFTEWIIETLAVSALVLAVLVWLRRLYLSYRMSHFFDERMAIDPVIVTAARREVAERPVEALFRLFSIVVSVFLVVLGVAVGAVVFLATTSALSCMRSPKCI